MIAKLRACEHALAGGVDDVVIVDGRIAAALVGASESAAPQMATRITAGLKACAATAGNRDAEERGDDDDDGDWTTWSGARRGTCCRPTGASR